MAVICSTIQKCLLSACGILATLLRVRESKDKSYTGERQINGKFQNVEM